MRLPLLQRTGAALLLATALLVLTLGVAAAQAGEARLLPVADATAQVTVGDVTSLMLEVTHPADTIAIMPDLGEQWGDFEVRGLSAPSVSEGEDGTLTTSRRIDLALYAPGVYATPLLPVRVVNTAGASWEVQAPPLTLSVQSVLGEPEPPLRGAKAQASVRIPVLPVVVIALATLLLLSLLLWWFWRRGGMARLGARTPTDRALAELNQLAAAGLIQQGRFKELYLGISLTIRRQLEREAGLPVEDRTTRELRALLRRSIVPGETGRRVIDLLTECDLVKFAEVTPTAQGANALLDEARSIVREVGTVRSSQPTTATPRVAGSRP